MSGPNEPVIAKRAGIAPFLAMDVLSAAAAMETRRESGLRVLHLEVGEPAAGAPRTARRAAQAALGEDRPLGYTEACGIFPLRARIAQHYRDWYGIDLDPARVIVTPGASGGLMLAFLACFDPGARIALAAPYYPPYVNMLRTLGLEPVFLRTPASARHQVTLEALSALDPPPDGLLIASPANPTGAMLRPEELAALGAWCESRGVVLISDEIYHGLNYDVPLATALGVNGGAVVVNSFSKYFGMTGWRVGWLVAPPHLVRPIERLAQNFFISAPHLAQIAALAAFEGKKELAARLPRYREARDLLLEALPRAGFRRILPPEGAFYIYAEIPEDAPPSDVFCRDLLAATAIALTPGLDFDHEEGARFVRLSYCRPLEEIRDAAKRLIAWRSARR